MSEIKSNIEGVRPLLEHINEYESRLELVHKAIVLRDLALLRRTVASLKTLQESLSTEDPYVVEVAHDLRSPLTILVGILEIMKLPAQINKSDYWFKKLEERYPSFLEKIYAVKRSVEDPLSVSEVRVGANIRSLQRVFAEHVLGVSVEDSGSGKFVAGERRFYVSIPETNMIGLSNWPILTRAILNLLANASHHNLKGELEVLLSVRNSEDQHGVEVHIMDTGKGIDEPEKVFQRGWTTNREGGNSGLGLHIVRSTLEAVGAKIVLRGHGGPEGGAHFIITMPRPQPNQ